MTDEDNGKNKQKEGEGEQEVGKETDASAGSKNAENNDGQPGPFP